ncbi:calcium-binding mitochondrial carrier protein SCaMC-3-like [Contarinia nasturtii]|uniref:calcium-binding mitochondrial carrier protein SCaMC-3-like n=1 Tax=Contarinia nasturtii TaxID=265458 RepID=UPI0012D37489|nr:calcium-binding mitochondrial carrier protein SCaMC-3-like [Contarinia nasturtii]
MSSVMSSSSADEIIKKCHDVGEKLQTESGKNVNTAGHHHTNISNHQVHYLHELPLAAEKRYEMLFSQLDRNGNGQIDIHDLSEALKDIHLSQQYAETFLRQTDTTNRGHVNLAEFIHYVREHEKNLLLHFTHLDKDKDGKVNLNDLIIGFKELGIEIDDNEALQLLKRVDQNDTLIISYDEWRDFLLLAPSLDIHHIINFWRHSTYLDVGEDVYVPQIASGWRHLAAGAVAGAVSRTCTAPLDRLKVFLQVQTNRVRIVDSFRYLLNEGGVRSFWRGNGINVMKIAPESALKFAVYEKVKRLIRQNEQKQLSIYERFVAGACAGGVSQTIIYPLEVLKTRLALRKTGQYKGISDAALKIYTNEGIRSFYRGYCPNILGIVPYAGIDLAVYETLKRKYLKKHESDDERPSFMVLLGCGTVSSSIGQLCSYPLALVRTRLQAQVINNNTQSVVRPREQTMTTIFKHIIETEGIPGLYRGIIPNFIKVLPAVSISYVTYEYTSQALGVSMS